MQSQLKFSKMESDSIAKFTNLSDGTGESKVTKIDVSTLAQIHLV